MSRALPGTSPYASRTVPAMVLACSTRCPRTSFFIILGSLLTPFSALWAPKWRLGAKKGRPQNTSKNDLPKNQKMSPKYPPKANRSRPNPDTYSVFFGVWMPTWSRMSPGTSFSSILVPQNTKSTQKKLEIQSSNPHFFFVLYALLQK